MMMIGNVIFFILLSVCCLTATQIENLELFTDSQECSSTIAHKVTYGGYLRELEILKYSNYGNYPVVSKISTVVNDITDLFEDDIVSLINEFAFMSF
jgi:hypothetical protein